MSEPASSRFPAAAGKRESPPPAPAKAGPAKTPPQSAAAKSAQRSEKPAEPVVEAKVVSIDAFRKK